MIHVLVILLVLSLYVGDTGARQAGAGATGTPGVLWLGAIAWGPVLAAGLMSAHWYANARRQLDRAGAPEPWQRADRAASVLRLILTLHTATLIIAFGWLDAIRAVTGDPPIVDELAAIAGPLVFCVWSWWSQSALERRVREAGLVRALDTGRPVPALPSRGRLTWLQARHHLLIALLPLLLIRLWSESVGWWLGTDAGREGIGDLERRAGIAPELAVELLTLPGVVVVLLLTPLLLRALWQTRPLAGALGDEIRAMARAARVRLGALLTWDTSSTMVNALVVGPVWPFRQVMFSDALLERVTRERVLAVAAHEIAHVRFRHLGWLMGGGLAGLVLVSGVATVVAGAVGEIVTGLLGHAHAGLGAATIVQLGGMILSLAALFAAVILLSRRFEWQADAYAARVMTDRLAGAYPVPTRAVSGAGASVMIAALADVAALNGVSPTRPAWRHGSIALRQRRLVELARAGGGRPPIDAQVRGLKAWVFAAIVTGLAFGLLGSP